MASSCKLGNETSGSEKGKDSLPADRLLAFQVLRMTLLHGILI
jgi:hypothetical protein